MSTSKADFWSVEGWMSASRRETLTYLALKSFNTNSGVQLSTETKSARSRVAYESSLLLHWIDAIVRPEYSSSRCCVIKSPIQSLKFIPLTYFLTITFAPETREQHQLCITWLFTQAYWQELKFVLTKRLGYHLHITWYWLHLGILLQKSCPSSRVNPGTLMWGGSCGEAAWKAKPTEGNHRSFPKACNKCVHSKHHLTNIKAELFN